MKFILKLVIVASIVIASFGVFPEVGLLFAVGGAIYLIVSGEKKEMETKDDSLFPSTHVGTDISSAWLGARMDEEEVRRKQGEKEPRDQGH